jgi:DNA polymerase III subunit epsilon
MAKGVKVGIAAGWYEDPWNQADLRWWDGQQWSGRTATTVPDPGGGDVAAPLSATTGIEHLIGRDGRIAVIDVETTGLYTNDRIVEIAVLTLDCDGRVHDEFETLVQPMRDVGPTWIHGVDANMVRDAPTFADVAHHVASRIDGAVVVGHNVRFDMRMLGSELSRVGIEVDWGAALDTLRATRCKLGQACHEHGITLDNAHRAIADARATARLLFVTRHHYSDPCTPVVARPLQVTPLRVRAREGHIDVLPPAPYLAALARGMHTSIEVAPYVQLLDVAMADLKLTPHERAELLDLAGDLGLDGHAVDRAHREFLNGLIDAALDDGVVTDDERDQLCRAAALLEVDAEAVMSRIEPFRASVEGMGLSPGMTVCFTGQGQLNGSLVDRASQESMALQHGLFVAKSVTKKGPDLVVAADGDSRSSKARKARQQGIAICSFSDFVHALETGGVVAAMRVDIADKALVCVSCGTSWMASQRTVGSVCVDCSRSALLQQTPASGLHPQPTPMQPHAELGAVTLLCAECGNHWERAQVRGRRPKVCPDCASSRTV